MKPLTNIRDSTTPSSAIVAGGFSCGKIFLLCCFLFISGTALFAQDANGQTDNRPAVYPAAPCLFGGPMGFRITRYEGASKPYKRKENHAHALEYGPLLMAVTGESLSKGQVTLPFPASQLIGKLQPEDAHSAHFKIADVNDATLRVVPYCEIEKGEMTCFPFFTED